MPIVAAVDRSERAESVLKQGRRLADLYGERLHVVYVDDRDEEGDLIPTRNRPDIASGARGGSAVKEETQARQRATETAGGIAERIEDLGEFEAVGLVGNPAEELLAYARERDAECIVVSARKQSPLGKALFGSVTQSLLLNADRPIVAVPHGES